MGILGEILDRLFPSRVFKREWQAAAESSRLLLSSMKGSAELCGFSFGSLTLDEEIHYMFGFVASANDVLVQHLGAAAGRTASMTGTLRVYQGLFGDDVAEAMVDATDQLFRQPTEDFELGRTVGEVFGNSIARQNTDGMALATVHLFKKRYGAYCRSPL